MDDVFCVNFHGVTAYIVYRNKDGKDIKSKNRKESSRV